MKRNCVKKLKYIKNKKYILVGVIFWILLSGSIFLMAKNELQVAMYQPQVVLEEGDITQREELTKKQININQLIMQDIKISNCSFSGISIYANTNKKDLKGVLEIEFLEKKSGRQLGEWQYDVTNDKREGYFDFGLKEVVNVSQEKIYTVKVINKTNKILDFSVAPRHDKTSTVMLLENQRLDSIVPYRVLYGDYHNLKFYVIAFYIGITLAMFSVVFLAFKQKKIEQLFCCVAMVLGLIFIFVLPPFVVPDEAAHFATTYKISSELLGQKSMDNDGKVLVTEDAWQVEVTPNKEIYCRYMEGMLGKTEVGEELISTRPPLNVNFTGYAPQVIGVSLARICGMNGIQVLLLGRAFALIWYCLIMYWAIKLIPFGKMTLFIIGLFPMTLQQIVSYNYDSILFGICFLLIAHLLHILYKKDKIEIKDIVLLSLCVMVIASIKFIYLPIIGIALFIPSKKFGGKKNKNIVILYTSLLCAVVIGVCKLSQLRNVIQSPNPSVMNTDDMVSIGYCLDNPLTIMAMLFRTIERRISDYFGQMIATQLGWLEIWIPNIIITAFVIILFLSVIQLDNEDRNVTIGMKVFSVFVIIIVSCLIAVALLVDCTHVNSPLIEGIQGRYFLPILPLIILIFQNKVIVLKKSIDYYLALIVVYLNCMTCYFITLFALNR